MPWPVATRSASVAILMAAPGDTGILFHPAQFVAFVVHPAAEKLIAKINAVQTFDPIIDPLPFFDCRDGVFDLIGAEISAAFPVAAAEQGDGDQRPGDPFAERAGQKRDHADT